MRRRTLTSILIPLVFAACADRQPAGPDDAAAIAVTERPANGHIGPIGSVQTVATFNGAAGQLPEGIAITRTGDVYVTLLPLGQVIRVAPDGSWSVVATLDAVAGGATGIVADATGRLYVGVSSGNPATQGVHVIERDGSTHRIAGTEAIGFPNGLAFDRRGNLYVTDSAAGIVWRIDRDGAVTPWLAHALLQGTGAFGLGFPIGANGIAYDNGIMWIVNSEQGSLVRVPVNPDGSAGSPVLFAADPALFGIDGIALDVHGRVYGAVNVQNTIVRIDPTSGAFATIADAADGLDFPASLAFGTGQSLRKTMFIVNFAFLDDPAAPTPPGPGIVKMEVGVPGRP
jgi:sugar lactone lactonase YvrE